MLLYQDWLTVSRLVFEKKELVPHNFHNVCFNIIKKWKREAPQIEIARVYSVIYTVLLRHQKIHPPDTDELYSFTHPCATLSTVQWLFLQQGQRIELLITNDNWICRCQPWAQMCPVCCSDIKFFVYLILLISSETNIEKTGRGDLI